MKTMNLAMKLFHGRRPSRNNPHESNIMKIYRVLVGVNRHVPFSWRSATSTKMGRRQVFQILFVAAQRHENMIWKYFMTVYNSHENCLQLPWNVIFMSSKPSRKCSHCHETSSVSANTHENMFTLTRNLIFVRPQNRHEKMSSYDTSKLDYTNSIIVRQKAWSLHITNIERRCRIIWHQHDCHMPFQK